MDKKKILQHLDHTLLKQDATWEQIKTLCDEGMQYHVASVYSTLLCQRGT